VSDKDPLDDWLETCQAAALAGGRDLVTDADLAAQGAIREVVAKRFPTHTFVGEEQPTGDRSFRSDELVWIVDPLDGTTNYVHDFPCFAVSVALARAGKPLVGVIFDPLAEECFVAVDGKGAWCNGAPMQISAVTSLDKALVAVSLPPQVQRDSPDLLDFIEVVQVCQGVRRTGSAALNLAYVARGQLDALWANFINPWDVAAGVLLVREAGGMVTGRDGGEFDLWNPPFVAASGPALHDALMRMLTPFGRQPQQS
jgi:myo-inositol-1(or 4)-monophosphatase